MDPILSRMVNTEHGSVFVRSVGAEKIETLCQAEGKECVYVATLTFTNAIIAGLHLHGPHGYVVMWKSIKDNVRTYEANSDFVYTQSIGPYPSVEVAARETARLYTAWLEAEQSKADDRAERDSPIDAVEQALQWLNRPKS